MGSLAIAWSAIGCEPSPSGQRHGASHARSASPEAQVAVESLGASAERDESLADCVARERAALSAAAAEALDELGYDTFAEDLCRGSVALHERAPARCDDIASTTLREACSRRVAVLLHEPERCPITDPRTGRDPLCLAWATRDIRLCELGPVGSASRCRAVLRRDARACREIAELDRPRCERLVRRFGEATGDAVVRRAAPRTEVAVRVRLEPEAGAPIDYRTVRERGLYVRADGCSRRVAFTLTSGPTPTQLLPSSATIEVTLPAATATLPLSLAAGRDADLSVAGVLGETVDSNVGASGTVRLDALRLERGGSLRATFDVALRGTTERLHVEGTIELPIRDVDPIAPQCAGGSPR